MADNPGSGRLFGVITERGDLVRTSILQGYQMDSATKAEHSQALPAEGTDTTQDGNLMEPPYPPDNTAKLLEMNTYHYRASRTKSREGAGLGWELEPVEDITDPEEKKKLESEHEDEKDRITRWFEDLDEPLTFMLEKFLMDFEALGYAGLELIGDVGQEPVGLAHIPARYLRVHKDGLRYCQVRGIKRAWFRHPKLEEELHVQTGMPLVEEELERVDAATRTNTATDGFAPEEEEPFDPRANAMLWISNYTSMSDYYGMPDIAPAIRTLLGDLSRSDYNRSFFDNYGIPAYAVFVTGAFDPGDPVNDAGEAADPSIDPTAKTPLERAVLANFARLADKPYSTMFFAVPSEGTEEGNVEVRFERLGHDIDDAAFRMYRTDNRDEVLSAHGVPAERAGIHVEGALGGNFAREATEIYKTSILEQRQEMIEHQINKWILREGMNVSFYKFKLKEIDNKDEDAEHQRDIDRVQNAVLSPNEYRERWDMERIDDPAMDMHYFAAVPIDAEEDELPAAIRPTPVGNGAVEGELPPARSGVPSVANGQRGGVRVVRGVNPATQRR